MTTFQHADPPANEDIGKLILRITLAVLMLFHGVDKIVHGTGPIEGMLQNLGMPGFFAYGVYLGEILGPLMILVGWYARIGAVLVVLNMIAAIALGHGGDLLALTEHGGYRLELQMFYLFTALALAISGPGRFSLNGR